MFDKIWKSAAIGVALVGGLTVASTGANATTLLVTNVQLAGPATATGSNQVGGYYTGYVNNEYVYDVALLFTINGKQVLVNCDDLFHNIYLGAQNLTMTVSSFSGDTTSTNFNGGSYNAAQIGQMSYLLDTAAALWVADANATNPTTLHNEQVDLAALQLASWEVGNPTGVTFSGFDSNVMTRAAYFIGQSVGKTAFSGTYVTQLTGGVQAQLMDPVITPVPEPATWAMFLAGFGVLGFGMRRKKLLPAASFS